MILFDALARAPEWDRLGDSVRGHAMPRAKISPVERRKAEAAGDVVLMVLRALPESATSELLRQLIDITIIDPTDRALFDFLGGGGKPDDEAAPVTSPRFPVLSGGAAAEIG